MTTGERLRKWVGEDFGVTLTVLERVAEGADEAADVWRAAGSDGARYAVKWSGGGTPAGLLVAARLAEHGVPGVAAPLPTRGGRRWSERDGRRLSLLPWIDGDGALDGALTAEQWRAYGELLARAHAIPVDAALEQVLPREEHRHEREVAALRALEARVAAVSAGAATDPVGRAFVDEWRAASGRIGALLERADELGRQLRVDPGPRVVCHGDPHRGNLLAGPEGRVTLIDWDDVVLAPRERDLLFVLGGVLYSAPVGPQQQAWFFAGYGPADVVPARLTYYRCVRALEDLAGPAVTVLDGHRTPDERAEALAIFRGVLSPTGLARQALAPAPDDRPSSDHRPSPGSGPVGRGARTTGGVSAGQDPAARPG